MSIHSLLKALGVRTMVLGFVLACVLAAPFSVALAVENSMGAPVEHTQLLAQVTAPDGSAFVPLTRIPGIEEAAKSADLAGFLDTLYKLCIGLAAALAVVQILRGGITYMLGDSVTEKRQARHHIYMALFGLLLVLSPAIVFGIIDERILNLDIDVKGLAPGALPQPQTIEGSQAGTRDGDRLTTPAQVAACNATPNCRAITVQVPGDSSYQECSCETRVGAGDPNQENTSGFLFNRAITQGYTFAPSDYVYIATTIHDLQTEDKRACYAVWGGASPTAAGCEQIRLREEERQGNAAGFSVISSCAHVTTEVQVTGACIPPIVEPAIGSLNGFSQ